MTQNYTTNFERKLSDFYYLKVKTINGVSKCILYHTNSSKLNVGVVFCLTFPTLADAVAFATKFDMCHGHC